MNFTLSIRNKNNNEIVFEIHNICGFNKHRELIVINHNIDDAILSYKKKQIAEHLVFLAEREIKTNWRELDYIISEIMNTKIHLI